MNELLLIETFAKYGLSVKTLQITGINGFQLAKFLWKRVIAIESSTFGTAKLATFG
jgi:hypothetical protein